jgi:hypothetical protein
MKELLQPFQYDILHGSYPIFACTVDEKASFNEAFLNYGIWFGTRYQSQERKILSAGRVWKFIMHGAMVLYANNEGSIDAVSPVCNTQQSFSHRGVMVILEQVYKLNIKTFV